LQQLQQLTAVLEIRKGFLLRLLEKEGLEYFLR
jgi:hypothetical protein